MLPPTPHPGKIICVGLNDSDHAAEAGLKIPTSAILFLRVPGSVVGPGQAIIRPKAAKRDDDEAEFSVVIVKNGRHMQKANARGYVAG